MSQYYSQTFHVKWSDVDPNMHLRGTVYLDYADNVRFSYLISKGLTPEVFKQLQIGPIIFQVTAKYLKEVHLNEILRVNVKLDYLSEDKRKFGISHDIFNAQDEVVCKVKVDGAFMGLVKRKVIVPPTKVSQALEEMNNYSGLPG